MISSRCRPLSTHSEFLPRLRTAPRVRLMWEVCQVPDFRKTMTSIRLLGQLFEHLDTGRGTVT